MFSVTTLLRLFSGKLFRIVPEERSASAQGTASKDGGRIRSARHVPSVAFLKSIYV
jgi:hypothetical protein